MKNNDLREEMFYKKHTYVCVVKQPQSNAATNLKSVFLSLEIVCAYGGFAFKNDKNSTSEYVLRNFVSTDYQNRFTEISATRSDLVRSTKSLTRWLIYEKRNLEWPSFD